MRRTTATITFLSYVAVDVLIGNESCKLKACSADRIDNAKTKQMTASASMSEMPSMTRRISKGRRYSCVHKHFSQKLIDDTELESSFLATSPRITSGTMSDTYR